MLLRILGFLLETIFFFLISAALLRAYMNAVRVNMTAQPGQFVMALTNWIVKPLRRVLPKKLTQSRVDFASVLAALLLALAYGLISTLLFSLLLDSAAGLAGDGFSLVVGALAFAFRMLIRVALLTLIFLVLAYVIISWVQPGSPVYGLLARLTEPLLAPLRRVVPTIGGIDLSALVLLVLLQIGLMVLG